MNTGLNEYGVAGIVLGIILLGIGWFVKKWYLPWIKDDRDYERRRDTEDRAHARQLVEAREKRYEEESKARLATEREMLEANVKVAEVLSKISRKVDVVGGAIELHTDQGADILKDLNAIGEKLGLQTRKKS